MCRGILCTQMQASTRSRQQHLRPQAVGASARAAVSPRPAQLPHNPPALRFSPAGPGSPPRAGRRAAMVPRVCRPGCSGSVPPDCCSCALRWMRRACSGSSSHPPQCGCKGTRLAASWLFGSLMQNPRATHAIARKKAKPPAQPNQPCTMSTPTGTTGTSSERAAQHQTHATAVLVMPHPPCGAGTRQTWP